MRDLLKKRLSFVLKYFAGIALLIWILWRVDRGLMIESIAGLSALTLATILIVAVVNLGAQFYRWKYLVESHSNHYKSADLIPSFFAGFAFRLMVPGGHAEISKIFLIPGKKSGKVLAFSVEKVFQTYIKLVLVLIALPIVFPEYRWVLWTLALLGIVAYFFLPRFWGASFMDRFQEKEVEYRRIFLQTAAYSITIFLCLIVQYYILLNDSHHIGFYETALAVIFVWGAGLLPISVSGLGVRENLAVFFLAQYNIPGHAAVGISLLTFFINAILPALIGMIFIYKRRKHLSDAKGAIKDVTLNLYNQGKQRINNRNGKKNSAGVNP